MFIGRWVKSIFSSSRATDTQSQQSDGNTPDDTTDRDSIISGTSSATSDKITYEVEVPKPKFTASSKWQDADGERIWQLEFTCEHLDGRIFFQVLYTPCVSELRSYLEATHNSSQPRWGVWNPPMTDVLNMKNVKQEFIPDVIITNCLGALGEHLKTLERRDPVGTNRHIDWFWTLGLKKEMVDLIYGFVPPQWEREQKRKNGQNV